MPKRRTVSAELVRVVAEASRFPSREPKAASRANAAPLARRPPRIHRTGRTMQFYARTRPQTVEALYAIADQQGWLAGETLERALAALRRELAGQGVWQSWRPRARGLRKAFAAFFRSGG
jgi:hypothetical protein